MKKQTNYLVILSSLILLTSCSKHVETENSDIHSFEKNFSNVKVLTLDEAKKVYLNSIDSIPRITLTEFKNIYSSMENFKIYFNNQNESNKIKNLNGNEFKIKSNFEGNEGPDIGIGIPGSGIGGATTYFNRFNYSSPGGSMGIFLYYNLNSSRQVINPTMGLYGLGFDTWQPYYTSNVSFNPQTGVTNFSITGQLVSNVGGFIVIVIYTYDFSVNAYTMTAKIVGIR